MVHRSDDIRDFLARAIHERQPNLVTLAAAHFGVSRQSISKHLASMVAAGLLDAHGKTKGRVYELRSLAQKLIEFPIAERPTEDKAWREELADLVASLSENVRHICAYGFTEMFNNAVDHSEGTKLRAGLELTCASVKLYVNDDGVGIFRKIKTAMNLADEREAILELSKGKLTTDPANHSGEGIFFTSRMFDSFAIMSHELAFSHMAHHDDCLLETPGELRVKGPGTHIMMEIATNSRRTTQEVFGQFTSDADVPTFDKTRVAVSLLRAGEENLVSRSQAKRLVAGLARFKEVALDFEGVSQIGQGFADEIFRVFQNQHLGVKLIPVNTSDAVKMMIERVLNSSQEG